MSLSLLYLLLLKATITSFSGLASLPIIQYELVAKHHVLTDQQLNAAVALARTAPGPAGGYVISVGYFVSGIAGGIIGWLALITPALLAIPLAHTIARTSDHPRAKAVVDAVVAASAALILVATIPIATQALGSTALIAIAAVSIAVLIFTKLRDGMGHRHGSNARYLRCLGRYAFVISRASANLLRQPPAILIFAQELSEVLRRPRPAKQKALEHIAFELLQKGELRLGLHAFRDDSDVQTVRHRDHGLHDRGVVGIARDVTHEGLIDFDVLHRKALEVSEARVAGAEIVDRDAHAELVRRHHHIDDAFALMHQGALGDLQLERVGRQAALAQGARG